MSTPYYPDTYRRGTDDAGQAWIQCLHCERKSYNPTDIESAYCAKCGLFHDDIWPPCRAWWIEHKEASTQALHDQVHL